MHLLLFHTVIGAETARFVSAKRFIRSRTAFVKGARRTSAQGVEYPPFKPVRDPAEDIRVFVACRSARPFNETLGNVASNDIYFARKEAIVLT